MTMSRYGNINKTFVKILIQVFLWLVFFSLPMLFRPRIGEFDRGPFAPIPMPMLVNDIFLVIAFYVNLLLLMPKFFNKKHWWFYIVFTCLFLIASLYIHYLAINIDMAFGHHPVMHERRHYGRSPEGFEFRQFSFIYTFVMVWAVSMVYYLMRQLQESQQHAEKVYASALQSELSFLRAQINPHFLFNTLNNIYALALKKSDDAPMAIMKLSTLMRQLTNDTVLDYVPFSEEEKFIKDYIELQKLRLTEKTHVKYEVKGSSDGLKIVPRILIPFIDNVFKYGVSNRTESEIIINLEFKGSMLYFTTQNAIHSGGPENNGSSGVGLDNSCRRLDLLYKDKYRLNISHTDKKYIVNLQMDLS